ncbi:MAG: hypothetical protein ACOCXW_00360 [Bacteroidota bacterium]
MDQRKFSGTGRHLDFKYTTNKVIAFFSIFVLLAGFVYQLLSGTGSIDSILWGIGAGAAVFLTWAIAREFDPDHHWAAFPGVVFMAVGLFLYGLPDFIVLFWILLASRVLNRTTGLQPKITDYAILTLLSGWLLWRGLWIPGIITVIVFLLDGYLNPDSRKQFAFGALNAVMVIIARFLELFSIVELQWEPRLALWILLVSLFYIPLIIASGKIESTGDYTGDQLDPNRVQLTMLIGLFAGITIVIINGFPGLIYTMPVWAAITGISLTYYTRLIRGS